MKLYELIEGRNDPHTHKAVFMLGGPGSGKTFVAQKLAGGTGLRTVNVDEFYELLQKQDIQGSGFDTELYKYSGNLTQKKFNLLLKGRIGLIIDGTGRKIERLSQIKNQLEELGYDTMAVFVNTELASALDRNDMRVRKADAGWVRKVHAELKGKLGGLQQIFGNNMLIIDNTEDRKDFTDAQRTIGKFLTAPNARPISWPVSEATIEGEVLDAQDEADLYKGIAGYIMRECRDYLQEVGQPLGLLYRGYKHHQPAKSFTRPFRDNRQPVDSSLALTTVFNAAIEEAGGTADRMNSIFTTGDTGFASVYGPVHVVFPIGDFNFTWHDGVGDWWQYWGSDDRIWKELIRILNDPREVQELRNRKNKETWDDPVTGGRNTWPSTDVEEAYDQYLQMVGGIQADINLREAVRSDHEIQLSAQSGYYYIPEPYFFKYVAPDLKRLGVYVENRQKRYGKA
jgi:adenylate kinase family enzyme